MIVDPIGGEKDWYIGVQLLIGINLNVFHY